MQPTISSKPTVAPTAYPSSPTLSPTPLYVYGGGGGDSFQISCPVGTTVTGFYGYGGWWVNALGITCGTTNSGCAGGGNGGGVTPVTCGNSGGNYLSSGVCTGGISQVSLQWGSYVGQVTPACGSPSVPMQGIGQAYAGGSGCGKSYTFSCPAGQWIVGVSGRASTYLNSLQFVCGSGATPSPSMSPVT